MSTDLTVQVESLDGRTWNLGPASAAADRPDGLTFTTGRMDGFKTLSFQLHRGLATDYPDLGLYRTVRVIAGDGSVAWEGRVTGLPRSSGGGQTVTVQAAGWLAHAKDRTITRLFVDRDLGRWRPMSARRRGDLLALNYSPTDAQQRDDTGGRPAIITELQGAWTAANRPLIEGWYDAGPTERIGQVHYAWEKDAALDHAIADHHWSVTLATSDTAPAASNATTGNLRAAGPATGQTLLSGRTDHRHAFMQQHFAAGPAGDDGGRIGIRWFDLAVIGVGVTTVTGLDGLPAVTASTAIRDLLSRGAPLLRHDGIQDTSYPIPHLNFSDPVTAYDAILKINALHLWTLAVWEDRTVHYHPVTLDDFDWQVRATDPGTTVDLQGDDTSSQFNGITVQFTDVATGRVDRVTPDTEPLLADPDPQNPATLEGIQAWEDLTLSIPTTRAAAIEIARIRLAESNQPKAPGSITVTGRVRDRAGALHPVWRVRAGDRVAIVDHPNDRPRLIAETSYTHDGRRLSMALEEPFRRLDAILDRQQAALSAANLT